MTVTRIILGKGPLGTALAQRHAADGDRVIQVSRSGAPSSAPNPRITHVQADLTDIATMTRIATGASSITCCANPPYTQWATEWPRITEALIESAQRTEAVVVMAGNLYGYGPSHQYMDETTPLDSTETKGQARARSWKLLREAHHCGDIRATEVRGSDYLGPLAGNNAHAGDRFVPLLLRQQTIRPVINPDQPHSWTYLPDFAHALQVAAKTPDMWGTAWHVPSPEPLTLRKLAHAFAQGAGVATPTIKPIPRTMLRIMGAFSPMVRELLTVSYQFDQPFVMDSTRSAEKMQFTATPWPQIIRHTIAAERQRL